MNLISCVSIPFGQDRVSRKAGRSWPARVVRVVSPVKTPFLPGLTAGKIACHDPAAATAGFFSESRQEQPHCELHPYRRIAPGECFAVRPEILGAGRKY